MFLGWDEVCSFSNGQEEWEVMDLTFINYYSLFRATHHWKNMPSEIRPLWHKNILSYRQFRANRHRKSSLTPTNCLKIKYKFPLYEEIYISKGNFHCRDVSVPGREKTLITLETLICIARKPLFILHFFPSSSQNLPPVPRSLSFSLSLRWY